MTTFLQEEFRLKATNVEAIKARQSLVSVGKVVGGGIAVQEPKAPLNQLSGRVDGVKDGTSLVGVGTSFKSELSVGDLLEISQIDKAYRVVSITNDTSLVVESPFNSEFEGRSFWKLSSGLNPLLGSKEVVSVNEMFPHFLRNDIQVLVDFLRQYYISENASDLSGISAIVNTLYERRDVDTVDPADQVTLNKWFNEFANTLSSSRKTKLDPRTLLKHIGTLYREKGSVNGIKSFFRILFGIDVSVYLPWEDVLIASDGKWDDSSRTKIALDEHSNELKGFTVSNGSFSTNDGFLSDRIYLEDSFYWQQYSYDIRSQVPEREWISLFKRLMHPSGFIVFSTLLLNVLSKTARMPSSQPFGYISDIFQKISLELLCDVKIRTQMESVLSKWFSSSSQDYFGRDTFLRFTFFSETSIEDYPSDLSIEQLQYSNLFNAGSKVSQTLI